MKNEKNVKCKISKNRTLQVLNTMHVRNSCFWKPNPCGFAILPQIWGTTLASNLIQYISCENCEQKVAEKLIWVKKKPGVES